MIKTTLYLSLLLLLLRGPALFAQETETAKNDSSVVARLFDEPIEDEFEPGPLLNEQELNRTKWFYSLPAALNKPQEVYRLSLQDQKFKDFPRDILRLRNLQVLILSDNKLRSIPDEIAKLHNLQILILTDNKLTTLPDDLKELENLEKLYLSQNNLQHIPAWVGGLSKLRYLDVTFNGLHSQEIDQLKKRLSKCLIEY